MPARAAVVHQIEHLAPETPRLERTRLDRHIPAKVARIPLECRSLSDALSVTVVALMLSHGSTRRFGT
jgi:hypothetical protein